MIIKLSNPCTAFPKKLVYVPLFSYVCVCDREEMKVWMQKSVVCLIGVFNYVTEFTCTSVLSVCHAYLHT